MNEFFSLSGFLLRHGLQDGVHLLGNGHENELELGAGLDSARALVSDVLQRGRDVYLFGALCHAVEDHVDEAVGARPSGAVTAMM